MRRSPLVLLALAVVAPLRAPAVAEPPYDYTDTSDLSPAVYEVARTPTLVPMRDGVRLYAEVVKPTAEGRWPVVLEVSPYHGNNGPRTGSALRNLHRLAARGYAVGFVDLRGTGNSEGCMNYLGPVDRADLYDAVEWFGAQPWSNGRVGMTGVSYPGSTPILAAASGAPSLKTIVPIAGFAQMYDHQFQAGVPYFLQWAGPIVGYTEFDALPPRNPTQESFAGAATSSGCGQASSAALNGPAVLDGRSVAWHAARDWRADAIARDVPVFLVHGFTDRSVRPIAMEWFLERDHAGDKLWLGQWPHTPPSRGEHWEGALLRWFERHLKGKPVQTGPAVEVFLKRPWNASERGLVRTDTSWPSGTHTLSLYPSEGGALSTDLPDPALESFVASATADGVVYETEPLVGDLLLSGSPSVTLHAAVEPARIDLIVAVYAVGDDGVDLLTQASINPELREGLHRVEPIEPGQLMLLRPPSQPVEVLIPAGRRLRVVVSSTNEDKVPTFAGPGRVWVALGGASPTRVDLPFIGAPTLWQDPSPI